MDAPAARVRLRVSPRARRSELIGRHGDAWKVRVVAVPEAGRATEEALALVADAAAVPRERVSLVSGRASRDKIVEVAGIDAAEVDRRLERATIMGERR
jgi:uncharacterized protein YggU (UPF0235/DUF167 family)